MGILSSATDMTTPLKNACRSGCSYGWSTFVGIGCAVRTTACRFVRRRHPPSEPATDPSEVEPLLSSIDQIGGGVPGNDKDSDEPIKKIDDEVNETDTDTSNIPVNANDTDTEDSVAQRICDQLTAQIIEDDAHAETNNVVHEEKMGIWGRISSATGMVKQKILDSRIFCRGELKDYFQDDQVLADLGWFLIDMAKDIGSDAIRNKARRVPGGLKAYDRLSMTLYRLRRPLQNTYQSSTNAKEIEDLKRDLKELCARIDKLEKQCSACTCGCNKLHDQPEVLEPDLGLTSKNTLQEDSSSETLITLKSAEFS